MPIIRARNLVKQYVMGDSVVRALDGVDIDIEQGEMVSLTGPSGSGKSTLMHILGCLDRPSSGDYEFNGVRVSEMNDRHLAQVRNNWVGFVFQTFNLINRTTALDNVSVPLIYARKLDVTSAARRALDRVGLSQRARHRPNELSGGERQRVAIARAIVNEPKLILADEPTGNLDTRNGEQILEVFRSLNDEGVTVILVTHEMSVAARGKRLIRMRDGRMIEDRPIDAGLRRELLEGRAAEPHAAEVPIARPRGAPIREAV